MPCVKCHETIATGTGRRLSNGLMCRTCLPDETLNSIFVVSSSSIHTWYYNDGAIDKSLRYNLVLCDTLPANQDESTNSYCLVCLEPSTTNLEWCDNHGYIMLADGSHITDSNSSNTIISLGDLKITNSHLEDVYTKGNLHIVNSKLGGYWRNLADRNSKTLILEHCSSMPLFHALHIGSTTLIDCSNSFQIKTNKLNIIDCSLNTVELTGVENIVTVKNSTIDKLMCDYLINSLDLVNSCVKLDSELLTLTKCPLSVLTRIIKPLCAVCKKPVRGAHLEIKGNIIHSECFRQDTYSFSSFRKIAGKSQLPSFGIELELYTPETTGDYEELLFDLIMHGFYRCSDGTVTDELKSPILQTDKWLLDIATTLEHAANNYITESCGTHLHVACSQRTKDFIFNRTSIFEGITDHMYEHQEETEKIWGRYFQHYAQANVNPSERYSWLNLDSKHETFEYRLPVMVTWQQYRRIIFFCRLLTLKLERIVQDTKTRRQHFYNSKNQVELANFYRRFVDLTLYRKGK